MGSLKEIRRRIRSVKSTQQITKAMEMVAAAKLRRAQARALAARPYAEKITAMLENIAGAASQLESPLFKVREVKTTALVVVTSDRGLCGAYNTNVVRTAEAQLRNAQPGAIKLVLVGKKGRDYFRRRRHPVLASHVDLPREANLELASRLTDDLIGRFVSGEVDRVDVIYTQFISALRRKIVQETFLPVGASAPAEGASQARDFIFEPNAEAIFADLLPRYATAKMLSAIANSMASEQGARMIAMGAARKNAGELLDKLVLDRNRARQTAITREILDIVGGAEALK
jgi:F-type H+-transporting ATPase subunit gamma